MEVKLVSTGSVFAMVGTQASGGAWLGIGKNAAASRTAQVCSGMGCIHRSQYTFRPHLLKSSIGVGRRREA